MFFKLNVTLPQLTIVSAELLFKNILSEYIFKTFCNTLFSSLGQKLTVDNIHSFGQKAMRTAHIIGRKFSNALSKIENIGERAMPVFQTVAFPELGALASAGKR